MVCLAWWWMRRRDRCRRPPLRLRTALFERCTSCATRTNCATLQLGGRRNLGQLVNGPNEFRRTGKHPHNRESGDLSGLGGLGEGELDFEGAALAGFAADFD